MRITNIVGLLVLGGLILVAPLVIGNLYTMHLLIMVAVYILLTQGLNLILGYMGLLSLGQQAYLAIGAYASALLALRLGWSFWVTLPLAILITLAFGLLIGYVTLRLRGAYFVIVTIGFAEIVRLVVINVDQFGGPPGLRNIPAPVIQLGSLIYDFKRDLLPQYYLIWALAVLGVILTHRLVNSRQGRAFMAMRENEALAQAVGINVFGHAMLAFGLAVSLSGAAGAFYGHYLSHISPDLAAFSWTLAILVMMTVGGQGTIWGPIVGAVIFTFLPEWLRVMQDYRLPIYGVILMLAVLFFPQGLVPLFSRFTEGWAERRNQRSRPPAESSVAKGV